MQSILMHSVIFHLPNASCSCSTSQAEPQAPNAFSMLMEKSKKLQSAPSITIKKAKNKLFNHIIELFERYNVQFTSSNVHSLGKNFVKNLTDLL